MRSLNALANLATRCQGSIFAHWAVVSLDDRLQGGRTFPFFTGDCDMNQRDLNRAVARATGESVSAIGHMGFSLMEMPHVDQLHEPVDVEDQIIDWDALEAEHRCGLLHAA